MADNKNENQQSQPMLEGFDPSKLKNADVNLSQYGDDSSEINYNNPSLWGGENTKYTGENTKNSQVAYNPNATIEGLDPNYKYGQAAQMQNSEEANYIAKRNDEIASALYNAGKTSIQDVENYLSSQSGWEYSTDNEKANTINSVWKRLGKIGEQNKRPEETKANEEAANNMESDLMQDTSGKLYGKVTADGGNPKNGIDTLSDANSVYTSMAKNRIANFKSLQAMDSTSIAASIISGYTPGGDQGLRDLMQYDPAKYQEVKMAEKQLRGQMNINSISSGEGDLTTSASNGQSNFNNEVSDFAIDNANGETSVADLLRDVKDSLSSNVSAASASETMDAIENDMAVLQNRLKNLKKEASTIFKGDTPDYIVRAYVANRTAEIQDQLSILENRWNAAQSRQQKEWEMVKWQMEYGLKVDEMQFKKESAAWSQYMDKMGLYVDIAKLTGDTSMLEGLTLSGSTVQLSSLNDEQIGSIVDNLVVACQNGELGKAQCAAGIQQNFLPLIGVNLGTLSKWSEKQAICNEDNTYLPKKGDIVVMSSKSKPENGHMGIIIGAKGTDIYYLDWNGELGADGKGTEEPEIRKTNISNSSIYGYYNPTKNGVATPQETTWTTRYGKEYDFSKYDGWNKLSNEEKEVVKGILEYRIDPTTLAKSGNDNGKANTRIRAAALAIGGQDFDYEEDLYKQRYELVKKWNNATQAGGELSRNATAADELMRLYNMYHQYEGLHSNIVPLNWWTSNISKLEGFPQVEEFNAALQVAASELAGALKGNASPSEQELKEYKNALSYNLSPAQFDAKIKEYLHGINNKMASEAQYYEKITGKKPQNIYNQYEGLPDFVSEVAGIDLSNYFSDISSGTTKRTTTNTKTPTPSTSRGSSNGSSGMTPEEKAASTMGAN